MSSTAALVIGVAVGFALAAMLVNHSQCCAALGRAAFAKYGVPDLGGSVDATAGGIISSLGLT